MGGRSDLESVYPPGEMVVGQSASIGLGILSDSAVVLDLDLSLLDG